jgi:hypothetical protein
MVELISSFHLLVAGCCSHSQRVGRPLGPYEDVVGEYEENKEEDRNPSRIFGTVSAYDPRLASGSSCRDIWTLNISRSQA